MGINNNFNNYFAIPTIIAGASEIINTLLLPFGSTHNNTELQEVFTDERARIINNSVNDYQSTDDGMVEVDLNDDSMSGLGRLSKIRNKLNRCSLIINLDKK
ncbi:hypothetical protein [Spiroplasma endosymbiont of Andrena trimmerana]|uniref:hypothetical protein n=1 Tax=Spiroplasma endosymbiont of Andrena trimmerana TaxID=3066316 RepID=UPI0030D60485